MDTSEKTPELAAPVVVGSYQTALCIIPPAHICRQINSLRALYDKAHDRWPPHINLIYPFVTVENLPRAIELIRSTLLLFDPKSIYRDINLLLETSDHFSHRHSNTIFIAPGGEGGESLKGLRRAILNEFKHGEEEHEFHPHLTIGQTLAKAPPLRELLLNKARLLLPIEWRVEELVVLVRERTSGAKSTASKMKNWGTVTLSRDITLSAGRSLAIIEEPKMEERGLKPEITYHFSSAASWKPAHSPTLFGHNSQMPKTLTISTYNILHDENIYPLACERFRLLLCSILSEPALADILILQEVSDEFLSHLLSYPNIQLQYPYSTHAAIGPLPSSRNTIVLSRWNFAWEWLPFDQRHKGAVILQFSAIKIYEDGASQPLVVAAVHLTSGLSDSAVAAKKSQLWTLLKYLGVEYKENPWIIAGDFNITTSRFTIEEAITSGSIAVETEGTIDGMESMLGEAGLVDAWVVMGVGNGGTTPAKHPSDGEEGATFDPTANSLAAETIKRGSHNSQPQRYDRILFKGDNILNITGFNMFGFPEHIDAARCASDHWGIRATFKFDLEPKNRQLDGINAQITALEFMKASLSLSDLKPLELCLREHRMFPTDDEIHKREEVFTLVKDTLQHTSPRRAGDGPEDNQTSVSLIIVPVGSYGLGVWSPSSDIDILCIGCASSRVFFAMASHRLSNALNLGIKILRTVDAASGTMLELEIRGVRCDLQYCPAAKTVERYDPWSIY